MDNKDLEIRQIVEIRADAENRTIEGTAIVFNSESRDMGFVETIKPEAVNDELVNSSDILFLVNHNNNSIPLARSKKGKGSLKIRYDERGVHFSFKAKPTASGDEILEAVRNGDMDACSFAFRVADGGDKWEKMADGQYMRTINKFSLLRDFSIVNDPAYATTSVNTRGLDELKAKEELEAREAAAEPVKVEPEPVPVVTPEPPKEDLTGYYAKYKSIISTLRNAK